MYSVPTDIKETILPSCTPLHAHRKGSQEPCDCYFTGIKEGFWYCNIWCLLAEILFKTELLLLFGRNFGRNFILVVLLTILFSLTTYLKIYFFLTLTHLYIWKIYIFVDNLLLTFFLEILFSLLLLNSFGT